MERVPVVDKNNIPLMPTKPSKARKLVRDGKAIGKWNKLGVYYIQLQFEPSGRKTQQIAIGIDPGKKFAGIAIQSNKHTLFASHLYLPFNTVKKRMEQRAMMRRTRRSRRINRDVPFKQRNHRQKRFDNRKQNKLPPSIRANKQLELRVVIELVNIYPATSIVYEYVKARGDKGFSPFMVGQTWMLEQLSKIAPVTKKFGWQTSNLRKHLGLKKQKHSKQEAILETHANDAIALASFEFIDYLSFENSQGRGHCWQGEVSITNPIFKAIRRPPISRRQLHLLQFSKGGIRRKYGGTVTRHSLRKGDYVKAVKSGKAYFGWVSGDTNTQVSVSDANWKRIGQFSSKKVELIQRSVGLLAV